MSGIKITEIEMKNGVDVLTKRLDMTEGKKKKSLSLGTHQQKPPKVTRKEKTKIGEKAEKNI